MALKRAFRLRKNGDFQQVRQQGRSITSRLLILAWSPNNVAQLRIGLVVSKRITKLAVRRNYLKRLLGEAIRPTLHNLPVGMDIVISARHQSIDVDLPTITVDIIRLFRRAHLLDATSEKVNTSN